MERVKVYSTGTCPICDKAKSLLTKWGIPYTELREDLYHYPLSECSQVTNGARTVHHFTIDGNWIASITDLTAMNMDDQLDHLMQ